VDEIEFDCAQCPGRMRRVLEVIDVWFDSGSMPFAEYHAPLENEGVFREHFPADFICEALDQTRGWFYSLLAVNTLLFDRAPYRNVVCLGLLLDQEGQKMSKSRGNTVDPWEVIDRYGADALRWYFFTAKQPWDGYRFAVDTVGDAIRLFLRQLWSTYHFYVLYANADEAARHAGTGGPDRAAPTELDRWARSRLAATVAEVRDGLEHFDATRAGRAIATLVDDLSNWYVRRSRRRFWEGEPAAFATLRDCLVTVSQLLAPFTPFIADELYDNLDGTEPSVHLCDFPAPGPREEELEFAMDTARAAVRLGLAARAQAKIKQRQPLRAAVVVAEGRERAALERLGDVVAEELNVKQLRFVAAAQELGRYEIKPNYPVLGPRLGKAMPQVAAALAALDSSTVVDAIRAGQPVGVFVDGHEHQLAADDVQLTLRPLEGYGLEREGSHAVALDLELDEDLRQEGWAREVVHAVQNVRKETGLAVEDRIRLSLGGDPELIDAARAHQAYLAGETLATEVAFVDALADGMAVTLDGRGLQVAVEKTG
jgi:isoleucyl-tRNA synthetase